MEQVKAVLVCVPCGKTYRHVVASPDDRQDLREGVAVGTCDDCFRDAIVTMMEPS